MFFGCEMIIIHPSLSEIVILPSLEFDQFLTHYMHTVHVLKTQGKQFNPARFITQSRLTTTTLTTLYFFFATRDASSGMGGLLFDTFFVHVRYLPPPPFVFICNVPGDWLPCHLGGKLHVNKKEKISIMILKNQTKSLT